MLVDDGVLLQRIFSNVVLLSDHMTDFDLGRRSFIQFVSRKNERTARVVRKKERNRKKRVLGMLKTQLNLLALLLRVRRREAVVKSWLK